MEPLVSVIMPAYNGERFIGDAIESIIMQSYINWELIIVEDCSTDKTLNIIQSYKDERIKVFCNTVNEGIAKSTNKAIDNSRGKYIALLDDDDIAEPDRLKLQVKYLENNTEIDILGGSTSYIDENGNYIGYAKEPRNNPNYIKALLLFQFQGFANSTAMIRKDFLEKNKLRYKDDCYGMQDLRFYMEASKVGKISAINEFLLKYRRHDANETKKRKEFYAKERSQKYAEFQTYSLEQSGFQLNKEQLAIIHKYFAEYNVRCVEKEEFELLCKVIKIIMTQAKEMQIDYYGELEHVCKTKMSQVLVKSNILDWD